MQQNQQQQQRPPAPNQNQQQQQQGTRNADQERVAVAIEFVQQYYSKFATKTELHNREHSKHRKKKLSKEDFEVFTCIGRGAFGEVRLCRYKNDPRGTIYVMKMVKKEVMIQKNHVTHVRTERNLMVDAGKDNDWLVKLYWTFQDQTYLYFIMEFAQGGDMMWWLIQKDTFEEPVARFYIAELVLAVYSLHQLDYAHRDLKPDNILLDSTGHLKLTDFGFAKRTPEASARLAQQALQATLNKDRMQQQHQQQQDPSAAGNSNINEQQRLQQLQQMAQQGVQVPQGMDPHTAFRLQRQAPGGRSLFFSTVGSPGYIAPEVLLQKGHDGSVDWWAVGVILYEMLYGYPPFYGDAGAHTGYKIARWKDYLDFPRNDANSNRVSPEAVDLIKRLVCDAKDRLSIEQILQHPFFRGVDWSNIRSQPAPFKVDVSGPLDTRYFDAVPEQPNQASSNNNASGHHHPHQQLQTLFYGFTSKDRDAPGVTMATQYNYTVQQPSGGGAAYGGPSGMMRNNSSNNQQQQQGSSAASPLANNINNQQQNNNSGSPIQQNIRNNNNNAGAAAVGSNNGSNASSQQVSQQSSVASSSNASTNNSNQQVEQGSGNAPTVWT